MTLRVAIAYNFNDQDWIGGRNYFASIFSAFNRVNPVDIKLVMITGNNTKTTLPDEFPFVEVIRTSLMDRLHPRWLCRQISLRGWSRDPLFERFLIKHGIDLLSHSGYLGKGAKIPTAAWLYDFQFMHLPQYWKKKSVRLIEARFLAACNNCNALIVSSNDALADLGKFSPECGLKKYILRFVSNPPPENVISKKALMEKYKLPSAFFYVPNQFWISKNHRLLIDALTRMTQCPTEFSIICTGKLHDARRPEYVKELLSYAENKGVKNRFITLGIVPYCDVQALMAHSCAMINPSRFEGWSTTVEEAKTLQKRLLLSNIPVHQEQAPANAAFFSIDDPEELAQLLVSTLEKDFPNLARADLMQDYDNRLCKFGNEFIDMAREIVREFAAGPR